MSFRKILLSLTIILSVVSCSDRAELLTNNDPGEYTLASDILWASPEEFNLTMDIYTPKSGQASYPVLIIFHGGGWLINDKSIMDQMSRYLATNSDYVICNVNYRLLADNDNTVTLNQIVDDVFGAVLWIKDNIGHYKGDHTRIAVTGDSAGGHLSAMIVNLGHRLSSNGDFQDSRSFNPSYLPAGKTAEQVAEQNGLSVQAAILSYGAFDIYQGSLNGFESWGNPFWFMSGSAPRGIFGDDFSAGDDPELYRAVSPLYHIPDSKKQMLPPQLLTVGSNDSLVTPGSVKAYVAKLAAAGHPVSYWEYEGRSHAYLDSGSNLILGSSFEQDAPAALDVMIDFLDGVFYKEKESE
jgi:acetyl esterase/lipase